MTNTQRAPKKATIRSIKELGERIAAIQANRPEQDTLHDQLVAVAMTLRAIRGEKNYIGQWLDRAEMQVREHHALIRRNGCDCAVCEVRR